MSSLQTNTYKLFIYWSIVVLTNLDIADYLFTFMTLRYEHPQYIGGIGYALLCVLVLTKLVTKVHNKRPQFDHVVVPAGVIATLPLIISPIPTEEALLHLGSIVVGIVLSRLLGPWWTADQYDTDRINTNTRIIGIHWLFAALTLGCVAVYIQLFQGTLSGPIFNSMLFFVATSLTGIIVLIISKFTDLLYSKRIAYHTLLLQVLVSIVLGPIIGLLIVKFFKIPMETLLSVSSLYKHITTSSEFIQWAITSSGLLTGLVFCRLLGPWWTPQPNAH